MCSKQANYCSNPTVAEADTEDYIGGDITADADTDTKLISVDQQKLNQCVAHQHFSTILVLGPKKTVATYRIRI